MLSWSTFQTVIRHLSAPTRRIISIYVIIASILTLFRILGVSGLWWVDLANVFAPYWYLPMIVTFPLSVVVTRQSDKIHPPRWTVTLQIIMMFIGLYWFAIPTIYTPITPPEGETFKVITYNILGHNPEIDDAIDWLVAQNADIIFLQETSEGYDRRLTGLYEVYAHESHIEGSVRIFSRYEIVEQQILVIEEDPGHLALRLVLDVDGRKVATYATHFALPVGSEKHLPLPSPNYGIDFALRYDETRRNQQIRNMLEILHGEQLPFILAGDFNTSDASLIYREVDAQLTDAFREAGAGAGRTWPVAEKLSLPRVIQPFLRIDYIWYVGDFRAVSANVGTPIGSDHLPVTVVFEWVDEPLH